MGVSIIEAEHQIYTLEGFAVRFLDESGEMVCDGEAEVDEYSYERAAKGSFNVADFRAGRFADSYPDYGVSVLGADRQSVHGNTLLSSVRDTYLA